MPNPAATRPSVTSVWRCRSPLRARSTKVAKITGSSRPSAGRAKRAHLWGASRSARTELPSAAMVMLTTDMAPDANAMWPNLSARVARGAPSSRRDVAVVDQFLERVLDVDVARNDAGLLQRDTGLQDGVALLRADAVVREVGPL